MFNESSPSYPDGIKKIVICGKSFIACASLEYLVDLCALTKFSGDICTCSTASDTGQDTWEPSLRKRSKDLGLPSYSTIGEVELNKDAVVISLEYDTLLREGDLKGAKAYNIHFSNLPRYRGCLTSVWPIRNLELFGGVTLHSITPGVDDGPIIDQEVFAIPKFWRSFDLYKAYNSYGYELFKKNISGILHGSVQGKEQDHDQATLYRRNTVDFSDIEITDFHGSGESVCAYIKSLIFPPYQLPVYQGKKIANCDIMIEERNKKHAVGEPVYADKRRAIVACLDRYVRILFSVDPIG